MNVWLVNGELIRTRFYSDFTEGGNPAVYGFVPDDELWIDDQVLPHERPFILFHELTEYILMAEEGLSYDEAHMQASEAEWELRQHPERIAEYGLEGLTDPDALVGPDESFSLRAAPDESGLADELGQIAVDNRNDHAKLKEQFLAALKRRLLAIALILFLTDAEATQAVEEALAEQESFLGGFIEDLPGLSEAQIKSRAAMYAASVGGYYNLWELKRQGTKRLAWKYNPEAEHCPDCIELDGTVRTAKEWALIGIYPRSGDTRCLMNCKCEFLEV